MGELLRGGVEGWDERFVCLSDSRIRQVLIEGLSLDISQGFQQMMELVRLSFLPVFPMFYLSLYTPRL